MRVLLLSLALFVAVPLAADPREGWVRTLEEAGALLRERRYDDARMRLEKLKRDMLKALGTDEESARLFAMVIGHLALAQAGAGDVEGALWNWYAAQNIDPELGAGDFASLGDPGRLLEAHILGERPKVCARLANYAAIRKRAEPEFPESARMARASGNVIIQIGVDENGRPVEPHVLKGISTSADYAALDALRNWRFDPPRADDPRSATPFCVIFNFRLR